MLLDSDLPPRSERAPAFILASIRYRTRTHFLAIAYSRKSGLNSFSPLQISFGPLKNGVPGANPHTYKTEELVDYSADAREPSPHRGTPAQDPLEDNAQR
jgi:hypothetical protein